ncbi:MAG: adenylate/guanylate cyclase domain-containing protein, partial [Candidatus Riflebacteria bacterium]|nr:adenylate/guanylate cyclase domain-containing protein [Candidatus Riflebacteria bacterium]
ALIIIIFSAIYSLYISLFNFNKNLKFKTKIILLTLLSSIFPFSLFSFGIYAYQKYNRVITETSIKQQAEFELNFVAKDLELYLMEIESNLSDIAQTLSKDLTNSDFKPSALLERLNDIADEKPISKESIFLNPVPKNLKIITAGNQINKSFDNRLSKEFFEEMTNNDIGNLPNTILPYLQEDYPKDREAKDYFEIAGQKVISYDIGKSLVNSGKFIVFDQAIGTSWINSQQLRNTETNKVIGLLMTKFEPRPILSFFFSKRYNRARKSFKEVKEKDNYEINYSFLPIEKSGTASIWDGRGIISSEDRNKCLKNLQNNELHFKNKTIITKENQNVPFLSVAIIKELQPYNETKFILNVFIANILYLSLIILFTSNLLDFIFVEPVMKMALNAKNIAKGDEEWNTEIKSGDEFEELNNNFKNLVTGLKERNILKSYVSDDAFSDIEESESLKLLPGGEYMEATIVFSALKDYDKLSHEITPEESIELLSKFMSIAEEVTKKYNGSIDKIIGDTIMLVFRNNKNLPSHALRAAKASLELVEKAKQANLPQLYTGIASGRVISGKIGSYTGKLDFTVIGNPVNSAARFKAESKKGITETGIIISGTTIGLVKGRAKVKFLRRVPIKGKSRMYNIYELIGIRETEN